MAPVLVYGSLKRGLANHAWLDGAQPLGAAAMEGLALHDLGPFPMAVPCQEAAVLHGELYGVSGAQLARLDQLEGVPRLYERRWWPLLAGGAAWVYVGRAAQVRHAPRLAEGHWGGPRPGRRSRGEAPPA